MYERKLPSNPDPKYTAMNCSLPNCLSTTGPRLLSDMQFTMRCMGEPCSSSGVSSLHTSPCAMLAFTLAPTAVNA